MKRLRDVEPRLGGEEPKRDGAGAFEEVEMGGDTPGVLVTDRPKEIVERGEESTIRVASRENGDFQRPKRTTPVKERRLEAATVPRVIKEP